MILSCNNYLPFTREIPINLLSRSIRKCDLLDIDSST